MIGGWPGSYDDIIDLPHHVSAWHRPMPLRGRAAQFAPFAALGGYADAIKEAHRLTQARIEQSDDARAALDKAHRRLLLRLRRGERPAVRIRYFEKDARKSGGRYVSFSGTLRRVDETARLLIFEGGKTIAFGQVFSLELF